MDGWAKRINVYLFEANSIWIVGDRPTTIETQQNEFHVSHFRKFKIFANGHSTQALHKLWISNEEKNTQKKRS